MVRSIISLLLLIVSASLSFKHAWDTLRYKNNPETLKMIASLGISEASVPLLSVLSIVIGALVLIPKTFFLGNLLNAVVIVLIMALAARAGNYKMVLIEIPFLAMPLIMIALKYPFKN
ncbi:hypothetical protein [Chitinophaga pinensis]|uniref:DoxX family protein n=1 Tax=Chitinophaga pinensis (strain ATCC 43595 / DSM 2588 / LMG 13176 / NBRC 15968 / NCIMB 11800 / UQM 2034) TaxID=485918 RepID=A0A979G6L0_CHIPD|nr:hypothetical protein [Chitinophaga pinensis]ACU61771.1 hypothetical protein Cpin_4323 [Chitinophaga pinensis DSM 2588]